ncbi:biotin transporter BioY [Fictibacillus gelatini]|uniref:biotin transporter BioY n=1 Tax=Fictibacillus gelatini TaxID=225985 RepID=UPI0004141C5D|nr:biotin transporter BioY [Fictibacillus gelatini]
MKLRDMMFIALFAALMCVLSFIPPIPLPFTPVPITLQTIGVMLSGAVLGARLGALSQVLFLLIVAVGAPVLAGGRGGISVFVGPSAGYLFGFPIAALLIGLMARTGKNLAVWKLFIINFLGGALFLYLCGVPVTAFVADIGLKAAAISAITYLPGDLAKAIIAAYLSAKIRKSWSIDQKRPSSAA